MNRKQILFSGLFGLFCTVAFAQEKSKTYKENFNVSENAILEINTTHADIEFETWDKNQVEIIATIALEGASEDEAQEYFEAIPIEIKGNSKEIEISTSSRNSWPLIAGQNFDFHFDVPKMELLFEDLEFPELPELAVIPEMPELPPLPKMPFPSFDYDEFQKNGEDYMKKWKKEFDKNFDKEYQERFEAWGKEMKERSERMKERLEERKAEREEAMEARREALEAREQVREQAMEARREAHELRRQVLEENREALREQRKGLKKNYDRSIIISRDSDEEPSIFYFSSDGEGKRYKVKKTIKIKMPKSVRLKMNVKHGEVKLASTMKNINASLRYASLLASTIDGGNTDIRASYSPVSVQKWNYGRLQTDYSEKVNLKEVGELSLNAVSSNVTIDRLNRKAYLVSNLGALQINSIDKGFTDMDITVKNGELSCKIPDGAFLVEVEESHSDLKYPSTLVLKKSEGFGNTKHTGYHVNRKTPKSIKINSRYSDVVLKD